MYVASLWRRVWWRRLPLHSPLQCALVMAWELNCTPAAQRSRGVVAECALHHLYIYSCMCGHLRLGNVLPSLLWRCHTALPASPPSRCHRLSFPCSCGCAVAPSTRVVAWQGKELRHGLQAFVAPTATVIGDVSLGEKSSVWHSAVVRGVSPHSCSRCPTGAIVRRSTVDGVVVVPLQARARP